MNERFLRTGEQCTCEYVTLLQFFHRGTLSVHWYIPQNFQPTFSMSVLFKRCSKTAMFSRFLKVAIAMSNFRNESIMADFSPEFSVSVLKEITTLVREYVYETRK